MDSQANIFLFKIDFSFLLRRNFTNKTNMHGFANQSNVDKSNNFISVIIMLLKQYANAEILFINVVITNFKNIIKTISQIRFKCPSQWGWNSIQNGPDPL